MKRSKKFGQVTFKDVLNVLGEFLAGRINRLGDGTLTMLILGAVILTLWTAIFGLDVFLSGTPKDLDVLPPWTVAYNVTGWTLTKAKTVACWPIKAAFSCCIPGLGAQATTTLWKLAGTGEHAERLVVQGKEDVPLKYTLMPERDQLFDGNGKCGQRWAYRNDYGYDKQFILKIYPRHYVLTTDSGPVLVTAETFDKVKEQDVIEISGNHELLAPVAYDDVVIRQAVLGGDYVGLDTAYNAFMTSLAKSNNESPKECAEERKYDEHIQEIRRNLGM